MRKWLQFSKHAIYTCTCILIFLAILVSLFNVFLNYFVLLRITDEGSVPEMRIWSILLINPISNVVYILVGVSFVFQRLVSMIIRRNMYHVCD